MADGDVIIDTQFELDDPPGHKIRLFACEDSSRPGNVKYRFHCWNPDTGDTVLRYDNAHDHPSAGWHHRHTNETDEPESVAFRGLQDHITRFQQDVRSIND